MKTLEYAGQIAKTLWDKQYKNGILQEKETRVERKEVSDSIPEIPESTHKSNLSALEKIAMDAFKEEEHPRDDSGRFTSKPSQTGWHATPYRFEQFKMEHFGKGDGAKAHGYGMHFAYEDSALVPYIKNIVAKGWNPQIYQTALPNNDFLLGEHLRFPEQSSEVKEALTKIYEEVILPHYMKELNRSRAIPLSEKEKKAQLTKLKNAFFKEDTGWQIYNTVINACEYSSQKASLLLDKYGIPGMRYILPSRGAIIWNEKAISIQSAFGNTPSISIDDLVKRSAMDSFVESEHPREKDGKFAEKAESGNSDIEEEKTENTIPEISKEVSIFVGARTGKEYKRVDKEYIERKAYQLLRRKVTQEELLHAAGAFDTIVNQYRITVNQDNESADGLNYIEIMGYDIEGEEVLNRTIHQDYVKMNLFMLPEDMQGENIGTKMLYQAALNANKLGLELHTCAAGSYGDESFNGYYTWPRLGYTYRFNAEEKESLKAAMKRRNFDYTMMGEIDTVSDFMKTPERREIWRQCGFELDGARFNTSPNSQSMKVLTAYMKAKGIEV